VYGEPGVGKTPFAATALDHKDTRPVLFLDCDGGILSARERTDLDVKQVRTEAAIREIGNMLYASADFSKDPPTMPYKTVVIDTYSELVKLMMGEIMAELVQRRPELPKEVPSQREYLILGERVREITRFYRDLPCNVIFCCHSGDAKNNSNATIFFPQFTGKLRHDIAGYCDIVGYMTAEVEKGKTSRFMQTIRSGQVIARDRFNVFGVGIDDPTVPMMWDAIKGNGTLPKGDSK
jgi:hypothetical protein